MFKVGDYVQRKEDCQDSWWQSRCLSQYKEHFKGGFRITWVGRGEDGVLCVELEGLPHKWHAQRFENILPIPPFNEADYL